MHPLYDKFCKLCEELAIKNRIDPILADLYSKRTELESVYDELKQIMAKEQPDVEKLKGTGIASIFYTLIGQKDKKLEKENAEAFDAEENFSEVQNQLDIINEEITKYERELRTVRGCELRYDRLLPQILDEIKTIDSPAAKAVIDTFDSLTRIEEKIQKFDEELELCREAMINAIDAQKSITKAYNYSQKKTYANAKYKHSLNQRMLRTLIQSQPIVDELCRQISKIDTDLVGFRINFEEEIVQKSSYTNINECKIQIDGIIPQIEQIKSKLISARDRWAKVADERRTELHEQIKAVLE
jgi:hypothetical protein